MKDKYYIEGVTAERSAFGILGKIRADRIPSQGIWLRAACTGYLHMSEQK